MEQGVNSVSVLVWGLPNLQPQCVMVLRCRRRLPTVLTLIPRSPGNDESNAHLVTICTRVSEKCTHRDRAQPSSIDHLVFYVTGCGTCAGTGVAKFALYTRGCSIASAGPTLRLLGLIGGLLLSVWVADQGRSAGALTGWRRVCGVILSLPKSERKKSLAKR